ncbi:DUF6352 family protein [Lutibaculum baratangense]|uniref:Uncharacterized protein n=1 Tax=Lutibaculum baratangense AMV1 TaxID=631454 RepID=V4QT01_9HYPH|nr:DUF6352 family protein [Lutibaculum baratangense]ESR22872.1 hypothetical protein N177_4009 [Lutibaculum baratangense AMV1]
MATGEGDIWLDTREFWLSSGYQLTEPAGNGWLGVTPDYIRAYLARPEIKPVEESCLAEEQLYDSLLADPARMVSPVELQALADEDAAENYRIFLRFRNLLLGEGTLEGAYMAIVSGRSDPVPPLFVDQLAHAILRNVLKTASDPFRMRAGEIFFREQSVSLDDGRIMLADHEIVEMMAASGGLGGLGQLMAMTGTPQRTVEMDVLSDDNKETYWARSDRFDTVADFRFTEPALDAFARVIEAWIKHFLGLAVRVQPMQSIKDERWTWHIGLDAEATAILNALYEGKDVDDERLSRVLALFRMEIRDEEAVMERMRGKPVYLGLAMSADRRLRMKPQNLLVNLPLAGR